MVRDNQLRRKIFPFPFSLNRERVPALLRKFIPCSDHPGKIFHSSELSRSEFARCVSTFRAGNTWKTTSPLRHRHSNVIFRQLVNQVDFPVVLDVGVSDGSTSLELIEILQNKFQSYYVTDLFFELYYIEKGNLLYVYDPLGRQCIMKISEGYIVYFQLNNILPFVNRVVKKIYSTVPSFDSCCAKQISICQPDLKKLTQTHPKIIIKEYNVLNAWDLQSVDIIKVANVLNLSYFSKIQIKAAILNLYNALKNGGWLLLVENRNVEKGSLLKKEDSGFKLMDSFNGGSDVESLFLCSGSGSSKYEK